jgi:hypothetical protein
MENNLDHEWIKLNTGALEHSCSCKACKQMCKTSPCLGTPEDILNIIEAGYKKELASTLWCAGLKFGQIPLAMVQPFKTKSGRCAFLDKDDLCKLHEKGLKPIEGKLATHKGGAGDKLTFVVARTWVFKRNYDTITKIIDHFEELKNAD